MFVHCNLACPRAYASHASFASLGVTCSGDLPDVSPEPATLQQAAHRLAMLRGNEQMNWLCQSQGNDAPAILVTGWSALVRQLAMECIDVTISAQAIAKAEAWLCDGYGTWHFGPNGAASWRITLPDGAWATMLMPAGLSIHEARKMLSH